MAAPALRSTAFTTIGSGTSISVAVPAGAAVGDVMLLFLRTNAAVTATPPPGFALKYSGTAAPAQNQYVYWKRLTAADTGTYTFTYTPTTSRTLIAACYSGVIGTGDPFDAAQFATATASGGVTVATSITTTVADVRVIWSHNTNPPGTVTGPAGYSLVDQVTPYLDIYHTAQAAPGSTGSVTGGSTAASFGGVHLFGLKPAAGSNLTYGASDVVGLTDSVDSALLPPGRTFTNHVAIAAPRNGTATHTVSPSSGTVVGGAAFTPTAGRLLVCVVEGAVTSSTPSGWTLPSGGSAINNTGLYVWYRTAAGADSLTTTHNGSDYPAVFHFLEFEAGSTFGTSAGLVSVGPVGGAGPSLTGLSGAPWVAAVLGQNVIDASSPTVTWDAGTEMADTATPASGTEGYVYSLTYAANYGPATWSPTATSTKTTGSVERLVFSVAAAPAGTGPSPVDLADGAGLGDSETSVSGAVRSDVASLTDTEASDSVLVRVDGQPLTDGRTLSTDLTRSDGLPLTDAAAGALAAARSYVDTASPTDTAAPVLSVARSYSDTQGLTDVATRAGVTVREYSDPVALTDTAAVSAGGAGTYSDPVTITDTVSITASLARAYVDGEALTDTVTAGRIIAVSHSDMAGLTEAAGAAAGVSRAYADTLSLTDGATVGTTTTGGRPKVQVGAAWTAKPGKVSIGAAWVEKPWKRWTGSEWKTLT